jgi:drug/metabolite transporter superfamily protein YnfA
MAIFKVNFKIVSPSSSFFGTIGQFFSEIAIISMIETNSSGNAGFALGGVYVCFALPPIFLVS